MLLDSHKAHTQPAHDLVALWAPRFAKWVPVLTINVRIIDLRTDAALEEQSNKPEGLKYL